MSSSPDIPLLQQNTLPPLQSLPSLQSLPPLPPHPLPSTHLLPSIEEIQIMRETGHPAAWNLIHNRPNGHLFPNRAETLLKFSRENSRDSRSSRSGSSESGKSVGSNGSNTSQKEFLDRVDGSSISDDDEEERMKKQEEGEDVDVDVVIKVEDEDDGDTISEGLSSIHESIHDESTHEALSSIHQEDEVSENIHYIPIQKETIGKYKKDEIEAALTLLGLREDRKVVGVYPAYERIQPWML